MEQRVFVAVFTMSTAPPHIVSCHCIVIGLAPCNRVLLVIFSIEPRPGAISTACIRLNRSRQAAQIGCRASVAVALPKTDRFS